MASGPGGSSLKNTVLLHQFSPSLVQGFTWLGEGLRLKPLCSASLGEYGNLCCLEMRKVLGQIDSTSLLVVFCVLSP